MMIPVAPLRRGRPLLATLAAAVLLAACAVKPTSDISLIPAQTDAISSRSGLFVQPVKWSRTQPGCKGECPQMSVDSLVFPGVPRLTELVDHALAMLTGTGDERLPPYDTIAEFEAHFWKTAATRDQVELVARTRYRNRHLTVIELSSGQYFTGAAHGLTATQFLNWDNTTGRVLGLDDVLRPGVHQQFVAALAQAHQNWLDAHSDAYNDRVAWLQLWPFQESSNFALTDQGLVVKYDSYEIAPYAWGQPELMIPYERLGGILRSSYLPPASG
ncbi:MAG: RsiV family protein [Castellaniella sp.]